MKILSILLFAGPVGFLMFLAGSFLDAADYLSIGFVVSLAAWTFNQYSRPLRWLPLTKAAIKPEFDERPDNSSRETDLRRAA